MKLLAIETSTEACSAALILEGEILEHFQIAPRQHSDLLLSFVDSLLNESGVQLKNLQAIGVGIGPGSFMGVRLAVAVAQGLAFGAGLPVIPISTLQALAQRGYQKLEAAHIAAAWDARMGEIYWGTYHAVDGLMMPVTGDHLCAPAAIELSADCPWQLVGNAWQIYQTELSPNLRGESHLMHPRATEVAQLASYYYLQGDSVLPEKVEPQYLRQRVAFRCQEKM